MIISPVGFIRASDRTPKSTRGIPAYLPRWIISLLFPSWLITRLGPSKIIHAKQLLRFVWHVEFYIRLRAPTPTSLTALPIAIYPPFLLQLILLNWARSFATSIPASHRNLISTQVASKDSKFTADILPRGNGRDSRVARYRMNRVNVSFG